MAPIQTLTCGFSVVLHNLDPDVSTILHPSEQLALRSLLSFCLSTESWRTTSACSLSPTDTSTIWHLPYSLVCTTWGQLPRWPSVVSFPDATSAVPQRIQVEWKDYTCLVGHDVVHTPPGCLLFSPTLWHYRRVFLKTYSDPQSCCWLILQPVFVHLIMTAWNLFYFNIFMLNCIHFFPEPFSNSYLCSPSPFAYDLWI